MNRTYLILLGTLVPSICVPFLWPWVETVQPFWSLFKVLADLWALFVVVCRGCAAYLVTFQGSCWSVSPPVPPHGLLVDCVPSKCCFFLFYFLKLRRWWTFELLKVICFYYNQVVHTFRNAKHTKINTDFAQYTFDLWKYIIRDLFYCFWCVVCFGSSKLFVLCSFWSINNFYVSNWWLL